MAFSLGRALRFYPVLIQAATREGSWAQEVLPVKSPRGRGGLFQGHRQAACELECQLSPQLQGQLPARPLETRQFSQEAFPSLPNVELTSGPQFPHLRNGYVGSRWGLMTIIKMVNMGNIYGRMLTHHTPGPI